MNLNAKMTEVVALAGIIDPDAYTAATYTTGWVSAKNFTALAALISAGDLGASATINAKLEQATTSGGSGAKDITGKAITALTQAGTDDNKQAWINLRPEELDVDNGFAFVRLSMTVATATSDAAGYLFGFQPARGPATAVDSTTVDEVVA
jgi:hypothetical protein